MRDETTGGGSRWLAFVLVATAACSAEGRRSAEMDPMRAPATGDDGGATDIPSTITLSTFRDAFFKAACQSLFRCRAGNNDAEGVRLFLRSEETCIQVFGDAEGALVDALIKGVDEGRYSFDASAAAHCVQQLPRQCLLLEPEEPLNAFESVCEGVFEGPVEQGGACAFSSECAGSASCDTSFDAACGGTCLPRLAPGEACGDEVAARCSARGGVGAMCDETTKRCVLVEGITALAKMGEFCGLLAPEDHRTQQVLCASGLWCDVDWDTRQGTCRAPLPEGAPCMENNLCTDGQVCDGRDDTPGTCRTLVWVDEEGASCGDAELKICDPFAGLYCAASKRCEPLPSEVGASCERRYGCGSDLVCDSSETCTAPKELGAPCTASHDCESRVCGEDEPGAPATCRELLCGSTTERAP